MYFSCTALDSIETISDEMSYKMSYKMSTSLRVTLGDFAPVYFGHEKSNKAIGSFRMLPRPAAIA